MGICSGQKRGAKKTSIPESWHRLGNAFITFHGMGYKIEDEKSFEQSKKNESKGKLVFQNALKEFLEEGEGIVNFRFFQIGIRQTDKFIPGDGLALPLRNSYFFLKFTRYRENHELLKEIERLGKLAAFELTEIAENTYMLRLR